MTMPIKRTVNPMRRMKSWRIVRSVAARAEAAAGPLPLSALWGTGTWDRAAGIQTHFTQRVLNESIFMAY